MTDATIARHGKRGTSGGHRGVGGDAYGHLATAFVLLYLRQYRQAELSLDRAVALNPNDPFILSIQALLLNLTGKAEKGLDEINEAQRRDPYGVGWYGDFRGILLTTSGRYREAITCCAKIANLQSGSLLHLIVCHSELGARQAPAKLRRSGLGATLKEIIDSEVDFYEDTAIHERYCAIPHHVDNQQ